MFSFPSMANEINEAAQRFKACSTNGIIDGCVGCVDGLLLQIVTPACDQSGNVKSFSSGHHRASGINVKAACDADCHFIFAMLAAPGGANDVTAF